MSVLDELPEADAPAVPIPREGMADVLRNITRDLQGTPRRYRWFGVWWWPIKAMLRGFKHQAELPWMGSYLDMEAWQHIPRDMEPGAMLAEGLKHYQFAARLAPTSDWADTPGGDRIRIYDADAET